MTNVLVVVEDDDDMRLLVRITLAADPRLSLSGEASTADEALTLAQGSDPGLIVLDHFIHGEVMGLQAAPLLKAIAPNAKIMLFTSHDIRTEAEREPAIDAFLHKNDLDRLLPTALSLLGLEPLP